MKAFIIDRYGSKDGGRIGEMPEPRLLENDVLVQVHAAGINVLDNKIKDGEFKLILPYRLPLILGNDLAGVVVATRDGLHDFDLALRVGARLPPDDDTVEGERREREQREYNIPQGDASRAPAGERLFQRLEVFERHLALPVGETGDERTLGAHDREVADRLGRRIMLRDGRIEDDLAPGRAA